MPLSGSVWVAVVPVAITLSASTIVGGNPLTATIALSAPVPSNVEITLTSSNNAVAQFGGPIAPAIGTSQLVIPAGSVSATFPVRTHGVTAPTTVTLRSASTPNDFGTVTLTVTPAAVRTLVVAPTAVAGARPRRRRSRSTARRRRRGSRCPCGVRARRRCRRRRSCRGARRRRRSR